MIRKRSKPGQPAPYSNKLAERIVKMIDFLPYHFAIKMHRYTKNYSVKTWKTLIILWTVCWVGISSYNLLAAFDKPSVPGKKNNYHVISSPVQTDSLVLLEHVYQQHKIK